MNCKSIALLFLSFFLSSCIYDSSNSGRDMTNYTFIGDWRGNGIDADGNEVTFFSKVSYLGDGKYRVLILSELDTLEKPLHTMDGILENNKFSYIADDGLYEGGGILGKDLFEGYYKGPVDGTYKMWRIISENETK